MNLVLPVLVVGIATAAGTKGRLWDWIPASYEKLEQVERRIYENHVKAPFEMKKIAQLGTIVVPCTNKEKRNKGQVKDLVLIHGFASGNAFWAANLQDLAQHFNVVCELTRTE
jgi:abhydrolase domain-containing protein 5